jgi:mannose-6-phosphate isomerase-like protein (cupin superfamily)
MARVFTQAEARAVGLPGRKSLEIVSGEKGSRAVTLRLVEIPVASSDEPVRPAHHHEGIEECIFVLSGEGRTHAESGEFPLKSGDAILIAPGEKHVTRNTGRAPLILLCFFPVADIGGRTREPVA